MSRDLPEFSPAEVPADARIAIVAARFNQQLVDKLLASCTRRLEELGVGDDRVDLYRVPGSFELPVACQRAARSGRYAAVVALGCIIRGQTPHFEYVAGMAATGVSRVALDESLPVIFGVLTTNTLEQALDRTGGPCGDLGASAAEAALETLCTLNSINGG